MKESIAFSYNGTYSKDIGVMQVHNSGGLFNEEFFSPFQLNTEAYQQNGRLVSSFKNKQPIEFPMTLYYKDSIGKGGLVNRIISWLQGDGKFQSMSFDTHPNLMVYAQLKEINEIQHNGVHEGIIQVTMATNSHYIYSVPYTTQIFDVGEQPLQIILNHDGIDTTEPKLWIEKIGTSEFSIENKTTQKTFVFSELKDKEKIFVDNEKKLIYSNDELIGIHRGNNHNRTWLQLKNIHFDGTNELIITGASKVQFELQYKYYTAL